MLKDRYLNRKVNEDTLNDTFLILQELHENVTGEYLSPEFPQPRMIDNIIAAHILDYLGYECSLDNKTYTISKDGKSLKVPVVIDCDLYTGIYIFSEEDDFAKKILDDLSRELAERIYDSAIEYMGDSHPDTVEDLNTFYGRSKSNLMTIEYIVENHADRGEINGPVFEAFCESICYWTYED